MSTTQFDQFKLFLSQAIQDTDFIRKNSVLQDSSFLALTTARINALTDSVIIPHDYKNVISSLGMLTQDIGNRKINFSTAGFDIPLSEYRETSINSPRQLYNLSAIKDDGVKYFLADGGLGGTAKGVLLLNQDMEVVRRFPGFGPDISGGEYEDPSSVVVFTVNSVEYVAISDKTNHVVQIYLYDGTYMSTIGTVGVSGADSTHLSSPNGLAFYNDTIYISCEDGQPAGATANNGFVSIWDVAIPSSPVFVSIPLYYNNTGSVLDGEVHSPSGIFHDGTNLWVSNSGLNEVGAFAISSATTNCVKYIEPSGENYTLRNPQQIYIRNLTGGFKRLYIANNGTGSVEEYDGITYKHLKTYGIRAQEDNIGTYTRPSSYIFGAIASPYGIVVDTVTINEQDTNVLIVTDYLNGRIHRFNLDVYTDNNFVNFAMIDYNIPIIIEGWSINGNIPINLVSVQYRTDVTDPFQDLPQETSTNASKTFQFRLQVKLSGIEIIDSNWDIDKLIVFGRMA